MGWGEGLFLFNVKRFQNEPERELDCNRPVGQYTDLISGEKKKNFRFSSVWLKLTPLLKNGTILSHVDMELLGKN